MSGRITIKPPLRKPTVVVPASTTRRGSTIRIPAPREASPTSTSPPSDPPAADDDEDEVMEVEESQNAVIDASNDVQQASSSAQTLDMSASREVSEGRSTPAIDVEDTEDIAPRTTRGRPRGRPRGSRARGPGRARGGRGFSARQLGRGDGDDGDETPAEGDDGATRGPRTRVVAGRTYVIDESELQIDGDPKGDLKIDADGNLLGDRLYKANTFTLPNRHPTKLFMLAIDAARTSGFRDSLYFFRKNPLAYKLNATQDEKEDLISRGKLGGHLRTRAVTLIAARSAYKLHGAKMVQNGRWVIDDYYEDRAAEEVKSKGIEAGSLVGEPPDPRAPKPAAPGGDWEEREQRERTGEWGMYRPGGPTTLFGSAGFGPFSEGPLSAPKKAFYTREGVDEHNWMFEAARRTREADADWARSRKNALKVCGGVFPEKPGDDLHFPMGVYEPHAAIVFYRSDTQPTSSRWERLPDDEHKKAILGGTKAGKNAWGLAWVDTTMEPPTAEEKEKAYWEPIARI